MNQKDIIVKVFVGSVILFIFYDNFYGNQKINNKQNIPKNNKSIVKQLSNNQNNNLPLDDKTINLIKQTLNNKNQINQNQINQNQHFDNVENINALPDEMFRMPLNSINNDQDNKSNCNNRCKNHNINDDHNDIGMFLDDNGFVNAFDGDSEIYSKINSNHLLSNDINIVNNMVNGKILPDGQIANIPIGQGLERSFINYNTSS